LPYIEQERREEIQPLISPLGEAIATAGELNFTITKLIHKWVKDYGECYDAYDLVIGALECAKLELYRRKVAPYEDKKILENGDV
jgi:hypothetical protein